MKLTTLFNDSSLPEIEIDDIMNDSREHTPNSLYFSRQGLTYDGHMFINQAIENGAICIVHSRELKNKRAGITYIFLENIEASYPELLHRFYHDPTSKLKLIGVTGTNGKTTVTHLIQYLLNKHIKTASIGTLGILYDDYYQKTNLTTDTLINNLKWLNKMITDKVEACCMEASSQGLELGRNRNMKFSMGIFTNLTQDHLDYHLNMASYFKAKTKLFELLSPQAPAIINIDDEYGLELSKSYGLNSITCSLKDPKATCYVHTITLNLNYSRFTLRYDSKEYIFRTNLLGTFNIMNLVQSIMACHYFGMSLESLQEYCENVPLPVGRLEIIQSELGFNIVIDYAHSPDSIEKILEFVKTTKQPEGRIITVMGSAGKRDKSKRPVMGKVADKYSNIIYLTQDDPRDEKVTQINTEIAAGIIDHPYVEIEDRISAIQFAIETAKKNDIIVILGKGHETTMALEGHVEFYPGDKAIALASMKRLEEERNYEEY